MADNANLILCTQHDQLQYSVRLLPHAQVKEEAHPAARHAAIIPKVLLHPLDERAHVDIA
jgi:hypothetical protein